jgi:hypothetical protein
MNDSLKDLNKTLEHFSKLENWPELMETYFKVKDIQTNSLVRFKLTPMQRKTFDTLLAQYKEQKFIDALIIKGRRGQQSSLISALACCYALFYSNSNIYIIADLQDNAKKLIANYHSIFLDTPFVRNLLSVAYGVKAKDTISISTESIHLCNGSSFKIASMVGAAQADRASIGAGDSIRFLHITEYFGEYKAIEKTFDAIKGVNTFCIRESTPRPNCGIHEDYKISNAAKYSKTKVVFYPWWEDAYNTERIADYKPSQEVLDYARDYNPSLTDGQLAFMDRKLAKSTMKSFNEEYPATPELAFMQDTTGYYFEPELISKSMRQEQGMYYKPHDLDLHPIVMGIDPAYTGKDKCAIVIRQGMWVHDIIILEGMDSKGIFSEVYKIYKNYFNKQLRIKKIFVDKTGSDGLIVILKESLGSDVVRGVSFGEEPIDKAKYLNKGAEMVDSVKFAMQEGLLCPNNKNLAIQLSNMKFEYTLKSQLKREPKDELKKRIGMSPDELDALALTFAFNLPLETRILVDNYNSLSISQKDELDAFRNSLYNV